MRDILHEADSFFLNPVFRGSVEFTAHRRLGLDAVTSAGLPVRLLPRLSGILSLREDTGDCRN